MIRRILCPTDFSAAAINAVEYAAQLCRKLSASLTLAHVTTPALASDIPSETASFVRAGTLLGETCGEVKNSFGINCEALPLPAMSVAPESAIAAISGEYDLIVMGTNGADTLGQMTFGSHSYRVARLEEKPVWIVPETAAYRDIKTIVFASDCRKNEPRTLQLLRALTESHKPAMRIVHISKGDTTVDQEIFRAYRNHTEEALGYDGRITFERIGHGDTADAIEQFSLSAKADLVVLNLVNHGFAYRLFHDDLLKKISGNALFPVLVLPALG